MVVRPLVAPSDTFSLATADPPISPHDGVRRVLARFPDVRLAVLHGSVANGTAARDSDLDLAVMAPHVLEADEIIALVTALAQHTGRPVDLVDLRRASRVLLGQILKTGIRVLEADRSLYPALLSRHLIDEADFGPLRDRILATRLQRWIGTSPSAS